jgi:hypothetical protein
MTSVNSCRASVLVEGLIARLKLGCCNEEFAISKKYDGEAACQVELVGSAGTRTGCLTLFLSPSLD